MLLHTILTRPYVALFLAAFLFLSYRRQGAARTFIWLVSGYVLAWISEASSIRNGFPYGWYFYRYDNLVGDWLNFGVPVWDSVSYAFLCFAGWSVVEWRLGSYDQVITKRNWLRYSVLAACFTTILDVVTDPVAHLGDQWFLGQIYYYPEPGYYFDIPLSNFLGWLLVTFTIVGFNLAVASHPYFRNKQMMKSPDFFVTHGGVLFYGGIFGFNLAIAIYLQQWFLLLADLGWLLLIVLWLAPGFRRHASKIP